MASEHSSQPDQRTAAGDWRQTIAARPPSLAVIATWHTCRLSRMRAARICRRGDRSEAAAQALPASEGASMDTPDQRVRADVSAALAADPRLPYADEVAVSAYLGTVTLRGTVGSFAQRRAAVADARRTAGVSGVYDELHV